MIRATIPASFKYITLVLMFATPTHGILLCFKFTLVGRWFQRFPFDYPAMTTLIPEASDMMWGLLQRPNVSIQIMWTGTVSSWYLLTVVWQSPSSWDLSPFLNKLVISVKICPSLGTEQVTVISLGRNTRHPAPLFLLGCNVKQHPC